jgi:hypothetical protein
MHPSSAPLHFGVATASSKGHRVVVVVVGIREFFFKGLVGPVLIKAKIDWGSQFLQRNARQKNTPVFTKKRTTKKHPGKGLNTSL